MLDGLKPGKPFRVFAQPVEHGADLSGRRAIAFGLLRVGDFDLIQVFRRPGQHGADPRLFVLAGRGVFQNAGQRGLPLQHPLPDQQRMVDQERRHAQPCGIADAQASSDFRIQGAGGLGRGAASEVLHLVKPEMPEQVTGQHLSRKRSRKIRMTGAYLAPFGHTELTAAVDRGCPVKVADFRQMMGARLVAARQRCHNAIELSAAAVGASHDQARAVQPARFLQRYLAGQEFSSPGIDRPDTQRRGDIPALGNHPVRSHGRIQVMREQHHAVVLVGGFDAIDGAARAIVIEFEKFTLDAPRLRAHRTDQHAHETQTGGKLPPQTLQVHDQRLWAQ